LSVRVVDVDTVKIEKRLGGPVKRVLQVFQVSSYSLLEYLTLVKV
jgi:hypothetical protein